MTQPPSHPEERPLYSSRIIYIYVQMLRKHYPFIDIDGLLGDAGMQMCEVADDSHWFSQRHVDRFYTRLVQLTGNTHIAREAGQYAASAETLGLLQQYVLGLVSPVKVYEVISAASDKFTRSTRYAYKKIASNRVEISVHPKEPFTEKKYQCENRIGFIEAIFFIFRHRFPTVTHPECLFNGGNACRYEVFWEPSFFDRWGQVQAAVVCIAALLVVLFPYLAPGLSPLLPFLFLMIVILATILVGKHMELKETLKSLFHAQSANHILIDQIDSQYNQATLTHELGQLVGTRLHPEELIEKFIHIVKNRLDYDRGMILLADEKREHLTFQAGYGYQGDELTLLSRSRFRLTHPGSRGVFVVAFHQKRPFIVNNINDIESDLSLKSQLFAKKIGAQAFICCPVVCMGESLGILAVDNVKSKRPLVQRDLNLLMGIANTLGSALTIARHHLAA